jgi:GGDEF domain-containing protein
MGRCGGYQAAIGKKRQTTLDAWLAVMQVDAAQQLDLSIMDAAAEVVETLHTRRRGLRGSLRRMGNAMGDLGWPLEQLNVWIAELSLMSSRSHRAELRSFESATALAEGWAERYVRGAHSGASTDAVTGLGTPTVLRMRLKEIFQHCRTFGITPTDGFCFVVVEADTDDLAPFERDAVMITMAGVVGEVFQHGQTVIRHRGRVIVLAGKTESTRIRTGQLIEALEAAPITRAADLTVWTDELPESPMDLDRHLRELVG